MTAGFKHVGFLTKRDDQTLEEFYHHWKTVHSDLARRVPGLRKYVINPIDRTLYPDAPVDGFAEVWFDSLEAAERAWASPEGVQPSLTSPTSSVTSQGQTSTKSRSSARH